MTPTMVVNNGKLLLVLGSPGGPRIITTVASVLSGGKASVEMRPLRAPALAAA